MMFLKKLNIDYLGIATDIKSPVQQFFFKKSIVLPVQ